MPSYLIIEVTVTDPERWARYRDAVGPLITRFGGRQAIHAQAAERLEGCDDGRRIVMFEFPSMEAIHAFWNSPDYVPVRTLRRDAAVLHAWAAPGS